MISRSTFDVMLDTMAAAEHRLGRYCHTVGETESLLRSLGFSPEQVAGWRTWKDRLDDDAMGISKERG